MRWDKELSFDCQSAIFETAVVDLQLEMADKSLCRCSSSSKPVTMKAMGVMSVCTSGDMATCASSLVIFNLMEARVESGGKLVQ